MYFPRASRGCYTLSLAKKLLTFERDRALISNLRLSQIVINYVRTNFNT